MEGKEKNDTERETNRQIHRKTEKEKATDRKEAKPNTQKLMNSKNGFQKGKYKPERGRQRSEGDGLTRQPGSWVRKVRKGEQQRKEAWERNMSNGAI